MSKPKASPTFNLKAVVTETGIKPHTLRAWEQRYGLPQPRRTKGRQRIYTQKDIDTVKWLITRLKEGMSISRAVELWYKLKEQGEDPLTVTAYEADTLSFSSISQGALPDIRQRWINSCLNFDKAAADDLLTQAFALYPVKVVCQEILQEGLARIGNLWFQNNATVQQEHFTSALIIERLNAILAAAPSPNRVGRILVATPKNEEHTIALLVLSLLLRYRGWEIIYLGANVPMAQLESTVESVRPDLVVLSAQRLETAAYLAGVSQFLNSKGVNTAFGGAIFNLVPSLRSRVHGHFLGETINDAVTAIGQIMAFNPAGQKAEPVSEVYKQAGIHYENRRHLIEFDTRQIFERNEFPVKNLDRTNFRLAKDITAALNFGDLDYIDAEIKLSRDLLVNYGVPLNWQFAYFDAYFQAADKNLGHDGLPVKEWLDRVRTYFKN